MKKSGKRGNQTKTPSPKRVSSELEPLVEYAVSVLISCIGLEQISKNVGNELRLLSYSEQAKIVKGVPECISKTDLGLGYLELLTYLSGLEGGVGHASPFDNLALFGMVVRPDVIDVIVELSERLGLGITDPISLERMNLTLKNSVRTSRLSSFNISRDAKVTDVGSSFSVCFLASKTFLLLLGPETREPTKRFFYEMQNLYGGAPGQTRAHFPGFLDFSNPNGGGLSLEVEEKFGDVVERFLSDVPDESREDLAANFFQPLLSFALKVAGGSKPALSFAVQLSKYCEPKKTLFTHHADYSFEDPTEPNPVTDDQMFALSRILARPAIGIRTPEMKLAERYLRKLAKASFVKHPPTRPIFRSYVSFGLDVGSLADPGPYLKVAKKLGWVAAGGAPKRDEADTLSFFTIRAKPAPKSFDSYSKIGAEPAKKSSINGTVRSIARMKI